MRYNFHIDQKNTNFNKFFQNTNPSHWTFWTMSSNAVKILIICNILLVIIELCINLSITSDEVYIQCNINNNVHRKTQISHSIATFRYFDFFSSHKYTTLDSLRIYFSFFFFLSLLPARVYASARFKLEWNKHIVGQQKIPHP